MSNANELVKEFNDLAKDEHVKKSITRMNEILNKLLDTEGICENAAYEWQEWVMPYFEEPDCLISQLKHKY
jgi:hypothetical protein